MRSPEDRLVDEQEPIAVRSAAQLSSNPLYRWHFAVVNKLRHLIVAENGFLEVCQACLGRLRGAGNRVEITEVTCEVLWVAGASLNSGESKPTQLAARGKVRTTRLNGVELPDAHQFHGCLASIQEGSTLTGIVGYGSKVIAKRSGGDQLLNQRIRLDEGGIRPGVGLLSHDCIKSRRSTAAIDKILLVHQVGPFACPRKRDGHNPILFELPDDLKEFIPGRRRS